MRTPTSAWNFGTVYPAANGSAANMRLGGADFLIQQQWVNASGGYCALSFNGATFSLFPTTANVVANGGSGSATITGTPAGTTWTASSNATWLTLPVTTGNGTTLSNN